ncbi:EboA domain-containing protein [Catellatospora citrea]|uniref:EboA domain-containing protein n=1 Tax=Catellatospora citrea TaxID=53366 RepID=UPI0034038939
MNLRFGYGTNGFANHRLSDALAVLADLGYDGVALTLDHHHLDPYAPGLARRVSGLATRLMELGLSVVIETGARYLLDPRRKHAPTLLHDEREVRLDFLLRAVSIASDLGAEAVSCWSGVRPPAVDAQLAWDRLVDGCARLTEAASKAGVPVGFEPEPGMFVQDLSGWRALHRALGMPRAFGLTLDLGHCRCLEPEPVADCVVAAAPWLVNVQIEDMRRGVHEHLEFGEGEIDFPPVLRALADAGYRGLVGVELPRHSHAAPDVARRSLAFLRAAAGQSGAATDRPAAAPGMRAPGQRRPSGAVPAPEVLRAALAGVDDGGWLDEALRRVAADPSVISRLFPAAARRCGRAEVLPGWTADEAARAVLLAMLPAERAAVQARALYRHGDAAEKRAVLRALPLLPVGASAVELLHDAIRTNDTRLVAAALGPYAAHLDAAAWRQAVVKCVFMGIALSCVDDLDHRADSELAAMLAGVADERHAAGRELPADAAALLARLKAEKGI